MSTSSDLRGQGGGFVLLGGIYCSVGPGTPEDSDPGAGEDAGRMRVIAAAGSGAFVDLGGPGGAVPGVVCEARNGLSEAVVAGPAEDDAAAFGGLVGDRADTGFGGELVLGLEAFADVAEFGEDLCRADPPGAREGHDDLSVGQLGDVVFDAGGQFGDADDEGVEHCSQGPDEFALGVGLRFAGKADRCAAEALEQLVGTVAAAVAVLCHEGLHTFLAEAGGAVGRGVALDEGERDRAVDVGEDGAGAGPEAVEQGSELVGERQALGDQVVAAADECAQRLDLVRARRQRPEPVSVGTQEIGQQVGVAEIGLAAGGAVARSARLDHVGMDRHDRMAGCEQRLDHQPGRPLDRDRQLGRRRQPSQALDQVGGDCQEFRVWPGIMGTKEISHGPTQRACDS